MALIGTLIVWITYPTYNSFYAPPFAQQAVAGLLTLNPKTS